jgi:hypothetical protein
LLPLLIISLMVEGGRKRVAIAARHVKSPDVPLEVVQSLVTRVIWQAVADLGAPGYRDEARQFFEGETFAEYCDILGWNVRRARTSLSDFVIRGGRISGNHLLPTDRGSQPLFPITGRRRPGPEPPPLPDAMFIQPAFSA